MNKYLIQTHETEEGNYIDNPFVYKKISEELVNKYDQILEKNLAEMNKRGKGFLDYCAYSLGFTGLILLMVYLRKGDKYSDTIKTVLLVVGLTLSIISFLILLIKEIKERMALKQKEREPDELELIMNQAKAELGFDDSAEEIDLSEESILNEDERLTSVATFQIAKDSTYFYINLYTMVLRISYEDIISITEDSLKIPAYVQSQVKELKKKFKQDKMKKVGSCYYINTYKVLIKSDEDLYELMVPYYEIDRFKELVKYGRED